MRRGPKVADERPVMAKVPPRSRLGEFRSLSPFHFLARLAANANREEDRTDDQRMGMSDAFRESKSEHVSNSGV